MALPLAIPFIAKALAVGGAAVGVGYAAKQTSEAARNILVLGAVVGAVYLLWR